MFRTLYLMLVGAMFGALIYWAVAHTVRLAHNPSIVSALFILMFTYLAITAGASLSATAHRRRPNSPFLTSAIVVPAYNEDPALFVASVRSMIDGTTKPTEIWVTDDGSTVPLRSSPLVRRALAEVRSAGIDLHVLRAPNQGKRHAQAQAFRESTASVFITVDSDTILKRNAVEELLIPFQRASTMSVAGVLYGQNHRQNLLTRVIELGFAMSFISGRAAEGRFGAVRVNCGGLAAYRNEVVRNNIDRYLSQTFLGDPALSGDDRALTIFAREMGRCEYQPTAVAYSALPARFSHLIRQRVRWARSWLWGTKWLLARPLNTPEYWLTAAQLLSMLAYFVVVMLTVVSLTLLVISPLIVLATIFVSMAINTVSSFRYVLVGRDDVSVGDRLLTWFCAPLSTLLFMFVLNPLYWWAMIRPRKNSWGTRSVVEVGLLNGARGAGRSRLSEE